jgi:hypothetical protein
LRSLAARPATSSAKALRTRERSRPIAFACQPRARDAVNCDPCRHPMVESDHLRVFDGGSRVTPSTWCPLREIAPFCETGCRNLALKLRTERTCIEVVEPSLHLLHSCSNLLRDRSISAVTGPPRSPKS